MPKLDIEEILDAVAQAEGDNIKRKQVEALLAIAIALQEVAKALREAK